VTDGLPAAERLLVDVSAALARGREAPLRSALEAARDAGLDGGQLEEALLQSYLFLGYPAALNAFALWRDVSGRGPGPAVDADPEDWAAWEVRGEQVCRRVYGAQYEGLQHNVRDLHPDLGRWMVVEGYGKVLGRPGLELRVRELCIAALLAVLDAPRQLRSHLRGSLNAGASPDQVEEALTRALEHAEPGARARAEEIWHTVRARWEATGNARVASGE
jgi:4-carboxymuconolactone decarboxylase